MEYSYTAGEMRPTSSKQELANASPSQIKEQLVKRITAIAMIAVTLFKHTDVSCNRCIASTFLARAVAVENNEPHRIE